MGRLERLTFAMVETQFLNIIDLSIRRIMSIDSQTLL